MSNEPAPGEREKCPECGRSISERSYSTLGCPFCKGRDTDD